MIYLNINFSLVSKEKLDKNVGHVFEKAEGMSYSFKKFDGYTTDIAV
jgi:hypothetical protein